MATRHKTTARTPAREERPFVPYVRVSRVGARQGEGFISIDEQLRTIERLAGERGIALLPEPFEDLDASGGTTDRPRFREALGLVRNGKAGGIVVATLDRFSRDTGDALALIRDVEQLGGRLLCGDGDVSLGNGADAFTATVRLAAATFERARRAEYLDRSRRNAIERGVHLAVPYGYERSNGKGSSLVPVEPAAGEVRRAYELRAAGRSWQAIADELNAAGSERRWNHKGVRQAVQAEVYEGVAHSGDYRTPDAHPAIVGPELAGRARRTRGTRPKRGERALLAGIARCSGCGYALKYQRAGERGYYRCADQANVGCPGVSVPGPALDELAEQTLLAYLDGVRFEISAADEAGERALDVVERATEHLRRVARNLAGLAEGSAAELRIFEEQLSDARALLAAAEETERVARHAAAGVDLPSGLGSETYRTLPVADRRHLLAILFAAVVVRPAVRYREPVGARAELILANEVPAGVGLIAFVAGKDDPDPRSGVAAL